MGAGDNIFAEMMVSEEERIEQQKIAQVKQQGYKYFVLVYKGRLPINAIKIQGLLNIEPYKTTTAEGEEVWAGREGADAYYFREDSVGRKTTQIWDDPDQHNRYWVSRHIGFQRAEFEVADKETEKEILALSKQPFKAELDEEQLLLKKQREIDKRLSEIRATKDTKEQPPQAQQTQQVQQPQAQVSENVPEQPQAPIQPQPVRRGRPRTSEQLPVEKEVAQGA